MYQEPNSNIENNFYKRLIREKKRFDGRLLTEYRKIKLKFHREYGMCTVDMGNTQVLAQVTCEVTEPRATRINEGLLQINVDISTMCSPDEEIEEMHADVIQLKRCLDTCLKESRCIDLESLCITAGSKVWSIRVDITVMNYEGNMLDSCCLAAIGALVHFRRPNVSVLGETVKIHDIEEEDPIPLCLHHMPLCVTFVCYDNGDTNYLDTTLIEEYFMEGSMVLSLNKHREICTLHLNGGVLFTKEQFITCTRIAYKQIEVMSKLVSDALEMDNKNRLKGIKEYGFAETSGEIDPKRKAHQQHLVDNLLSCIRESKEEVQRETREQQEGQLPTDGAIKCERGGKAIEPLWPNMTSQRKERGFGEGAMNSWNIENLKEEPTPVRYGADEEALSVTKMKQIEQVMRDTDSDVSEDDTYQLTERELNQNPIQSLRKGNIGINKTVVIKSEIFTVNKEGDAQWSGNGQADGSMKGDQLTQTQLDQIEDMMSDSDSD